MRIQMCKLRICFLIFICILCAKKSVYAAQPTITVHPNSMAEDVLPALSSTLVFDLYELDPITKELDKEAMYALSQSEFEKRVGKAGSIVNQNSQATYSGLSLGDTHVINQGTYLLVVRGSEPDSTVVKDMYLASLANEGEDFTKGLVTYTRIDGYMFTVVPQLVVVPSLSRQEDGSEVWIYDEKITLKMEQSYITGSIEIVKELLSFNKEMENATFVFQVDTYFKTEGHLYSSRIYALQFDKAGTKKLRIDGLPIGAIVKVSEIYSGLSYTASVQYPDTLNTTVELNKLNSVRFTNDFNKKTSGGGGVTNHFLYTIEDGKGSWQWHQIPGNESSKNGWRDEFFIQLEDLKKQKQ